MKLIFQLSKQNIELSKDEVLAIFPGKSKLLDNLLFVDSRKTYFNRLAYAKAVYQHLFSCKKSGLEKEIKKINWNRPYKNNFCVRAFGDGRVEENALAGFIWPYLKNPAVDLNNPQTSFHFFFIRGQVHCGYLLSEMEEKFEQRKAHLRPMLHPTSLHPRLARCMVNLTGAVAPAVIVDPFCGTCGILIEAGLMDFSVIGFDIDEDMLARAKANLKHFKLKHKLQKKDATKLSQKCDYIVTDLPYAKGTRSVDIEKLYSAFLSRLKKILKKRAVVCFPDFVSHKKFIRDAKLKLKAEYRYYLHKSLSKTVCVIEP